MSEARPRRGRVFAQATRVHPDRCALCDGMIVGGRARRYCTPLCRQQAYVNRERTRERTPEWIARRKALACAYRLTVAGRRAQVKSKRKGRLDGTQGYLSREAYLASMKRRNRKRRKRSRAWAHEHQTKYAGSGLKPTCATCGVDMLYNGRGRPRKRCPAHHLGRPRSRAKGSRPACATCGAEISWNGVGRPRKRCAAHYVEVVRG